MKGSGPRVDKLQRSFAVPQRRKSQNFIGTALRESLLKRQDALSRAFKIAKPSTTGDVYFEAITTRLPALVPNCFQCNVFLQHFIAAKGRSSRTEHMNSDGTHARKECLAEEAEVRARREAPRDDENEFPAFTEERSAGGHEESVDVRLAVYH